MKLGRPVIDTMKSINQSTFNVRFGCMGDSTHMCLQELFSPSTDFSVQPFQSLWEYLGFSRPVNSITLLQVMETRLHPDLTLFPYHSQLHSAL